MKRTPLSIEHVVQVGRDAPSEVPSPAVLIRSLRQKLHMTQAQLAKRVGLPQSHIAKIESNKLDLRLSTVEKIFQALNGQSVVLWKPRLEINALMTQQAQLIARRRMDTLVGTMALEKQRPEPEAIERLYKEEVNRLLKHPTSELWNE